MSDLISRQDVIDAIEHYIDEVRKIPMGTAFVEGVKDGYYRTISIIKGLPSAEPQIIPCKDCKSWDTSWVPQSAEDGYYWCSENDTYFKGDEFCSRAERKERKNDKG